MSQETTIRLDHGVGGRLTREFIVAEILPRFLPGPLQGLPDAAVLPVLQGPPVFTTDSYVVQPLEFPGGNIGSLAVHGTVNDLAVCGARPLWLSLALILEESFPMGRLAPILDAVRDAAMSCGITVATGDTKVVPRGQCDGLYLTASGLGEALPGFALSLGRIGPGDRVLVSGPIGAHGAAVLATRTELAFAGDLKSDSASVYRLVEALQPWAQEIHFMRDPTRGGLAAALHEIVADLPLDIILDEACLPVEPAVRAVAELLGIDPLHLASEGRLLALCRSEATESILEVWRQLPEGRQAECIGYVASGRSRVLAQTAVGGRRLVDWPHGRLLPRIC